jgi:hypothetical protein
MAMPDEPAAHVNRQVGIALNDDHAIDGQVELFGDHLGHAYVGALPDVQLANVGVDYTVSANADVGRQRIEVQRRALREAESRGPRGHAGNEHANSESAAAEQD